jgi:excisionase family DNA binding protein
MVYKCHRTDSRDGAHMIWVEKPHELLTRKQACELLQVSDATLDRYFNTGLLTRVKVGPRLTRVRRVEIEQMLAGGIKEAA